MMRKITAVLVLVPLGVLIVVFAVANRQTVLVSFDPFSAIDPAYAVRLPLFMLIFALVIIGVIVGGFAAWLRQASWRRTARALDADVRVLHQELEAMRRRADEQGARREQAEQTRALTVTSSIR
jgi:uncharacterized integral membrane protein